MGKTHEAIIIHNPSTDIIEASKEACAEAKKKLRLPLDVWLKPVWHIHSPFGHIVVVELPKENGRETEVGEAKEVLGRKAKNK